MRESHGIGGVRWPTQSEELDAAAASSEVSRRSVNCWPLSSSCDSKSFSSHQVASAGRCWSRGRSRGGPCSPARRWQGHQGRRRGHLLVGTFSRAGNQPGIVARPCRSPSRASSCARIRSATTAPKNTVRSRTPPARRPDQRRPSPFTGRSHVTQLPEPGGTRVALGDVTQRRDERHLTQESGEGCGGLCLHPGLGRGGRSPW